MLVGLGLCSPELRAQEIAPSERAAAEAQRGNYAVAYCLWQSLAQQGNAEALLNLGWMYHNGYGLILDDSKALELWQQAGQLGQAEAWHAIGNLYRLGGKGIRRDLVQSAQYLLRATAAGATDAEALARVVLGQLSDDHHTEQARLLREYLQVLNSQLQIRVQRANFRAGPNLNTSILSTLTQGTPLIELGRRGEWVQAALADRQMVGWIHQSIIETAGDSLATNKTLQATGEKGS